MNPSEAERGNREFVRPFAPRRGAPKPANFDALAAAWNDPHAFEIERRKYQEQLDGKRRKQA